MAELPRVSIIIPHFNDLQHLDLCLRSIAAQTYPADHLEVIVADNASPQGLEAVEAVVAGRARVLVVTDRGAGPARNGGVAASTGQILAFLDSDCQAEPEWIAEGVRALGGFDFIGGRVTVLVEDWGNVTPVEAFERIFAFDFRHYIKRKGFTGAGNLFCSRDLFQDVGGFRTVVSEDVEWSRRATAAGYRLGYAPKAIVGHPARRTWDELLTKWRRVNAEMYQLYSEEPFGRMRWVFRSLALPPSALAHTPRLLLSPKLTTLGQRLRALPVLYRIRFWRCRDAIGLFLNSK